MGVGSRRREASVSQTQAGFTVSAQWHATEWAGAAPRLETAAWCGVQSHPLLTGAFPSLR